jgi:DNA-directed RNA polymerase specialized sigma54-like protein
LLQEGNRKAEADTPATPDARDLLLRARFINQRLSVLSRLITTLCNQQTEYLVSGDPRQLKPLAQAELARQLGEHPSTVSRLIRSKVVDTPWGRTPLLFLCQSKTDVVARLVAQYPGLTDQEVVSRLREEYDCYIARRTVAYHRGKRLRRNKQHKRPSTTTAAPTESAQSPASK